MNFSAITTTLPNLDLRRSQIDLMSRIPTDVRNNACVNALLRTDCIVLVREGAKHTVMLNLRTRKSFTIPRHPSRPIKPGTLRSIIRDAELTIPDFRELL